MVSPYVVALAGGVLIGAAVRFFWILNGRVAGISGLLAELWQPDAEGRGITAWFLGGLVFGGLVLSFAFPSLFSATSVRAWPLMIGAGLLVGFGTRWANGCTSGHGLWGVSRLSKRSLLATVVFMALGGVAVLIAKQWIGGPA